MSQQIKLHDQTITLSDFGGFKFLEAMGLFGEIMEIVPKADEEIGRYTREWLAANGSERVYDRAAARYLFGDDPRLESISEEEWQQSEQRLRLAKAPDASAAFMRAFPAVYKHARPQVENLMCLMACPNSALEEADREGKADSIYEPGGAVHKMRPLVIHNAKLHQQIALLLGCLRQLAEELRESDLGGQMGELREVMAEVRTAISPPRPDENDGESSTSDAGEPDERAVTSSEPSSSTVS